MVILDEISICSDTTTDNSSATTGGDAALLAAFGNLEAGGTFRRKFVSKNSKQLVFEFEELTEVRVFDYRFLKIN